MSELLKTTRFNPITKGRILWVLRTNETPFCFRCRREILNADYAWFCPMDKDFLCYDCGVFKPKVHTSTKKHIDIFIQIEII